MTAKAQSNQVVTSTVFSNWLEQWVDRGVDRYTFPDGTTLLLTDDKLQEYFNKFKSKVQYPTAPEYGEDDPVVLAHLNTRKQVIRDKLGLSQRNVTGSEAKSNVQERSETPPKKTTKQSKGDK